MRAVGTKAIGKQPVDFSSQGIAFTAEIVAHIPMFMVERLAAQRTGRYTPWVVWIGKIVARLNHAAMVTPTLIALADIAER